MRLSNTEDAPKPGIYFEQDNGKWVWAGGDAPVYMTGPAVTVFEGEIELQEEPN